MEKTGRYIQMSMRAKKVRAQCTSIHVDSTHKSTG